MWEEPCLISAPLVEYEIIHLILIFALAISGIYLAVSQYYYARRYDKIVEEIKELEKKYGQ